MSFGSRSLPKPTDAEWGRMGDCKLGCIVCGRGPADYHHCLSGGLRVGHAIGFGLCRIHHAETQTSPRGFELTYGDDQALLDRQNDLLGIPRVTIPKGRREARAMGTMAPAKPYRKAKRGPQTQRSTKTLPRRGL